MKIGLKAPKFLGISFGIGVFLVLISMIICFLMEINPKRTLERRDWLGQNISSQKLDKLVTKPRKIGSINLGLKDRSLKHR